MATWRAFVGEPGHRTEALGVGLTWEQARDFLISLAREFEPKPNGCGTCYIDAQEAIAALSALKEGATWKGDIDWDELHLTQEIIKGGADE